MYNIKSNYSIRSSQRSVTELKPKFSVQDQMKTVKLSILRSGVLIDGQFKNQIYSLLKNERPYNSIIAELEAGKIEVKEKDEVYRMKRGMLVVH